MRVGDLVKARCPTTKQAGKVFLVTRLSTLQGAPWIKVTGRDGWQSAKDFEVINGSR